MSPTPVPASVVHVLLQYICPPSQLDNPLPPHLLSSSLLQRHHFLNISPAEPADYLSWPSSTNTQAELIAALEACSLPPTDIDPSSYAVQYSFDGEEYLAHVSVPSAGIAQPRLILKWEDGEGWKYHDLELMPFPPGSKADLKELKQSPSLHPVSLPVPTHPVPWGNGSSTAGFHLGIDDNDDEYWNAYGSIGEELGSWEENVPSGKDIGSSEDAYWAQYSTVHGKWFVCVAKAMSLRIGSFPPGV